MSKRIIFLTALPFILTGCNTNIEEPLVTELQELPKEVENKYEENKILQMIIGEHADQPYIVYSPSGKGNTKLDSLVERTDLVYSIHLTDSDELSTERPPYIYQLHDLTNESIEVYLNDNELHFDTEESQK